MGLGDSGRQTAIQSCAGFRLKATLWHFHRVAVSLTYMYAVHARRTCTQCRQPPYETVIGWRPHGLVLVFVGPDMLP